MTLQDGLLPFTIKETIFLTSDKPEIGELKELELIPDVEIIENAAEISITGCLQLHGKYEPVRSTPERGGADSLVEAMKFTPFQLEQTGGYLYGTEQLISHRIPLSITIPIERVAEIGDIYAIVDSFDYQVESPQQLVIEAELKIAGITLADRQQEERRAEEWEFVHVANEREEPAVTPATLDDLERKLSELEQEVQLQEQAEQPYSEPYMPAQDNQQAEPASFSDDRQEQSWLSFDDVSHAEQQPVHSLQDQDSPAESALEPEPEPEPVHGVTGYEEVTMVRQQAQEVSAKAEADEMEPDAEEASVADAETVAENQPAETQDIRVAISGKRSTEESGKLNLTSIFSQASRVHQEMQAAVEHESSSSSARKAVLPEPDSATLEAVHNLTSFVRNKEERYSTLKLCIIQRDDTLESISHRYSLPVSRIVEVNQLTSDKLTEGQILYIPQ